MQELLSNNLLFVGQLYEDKSLALRARDLIFFTTNLQTVRIVVDLMKAAKEIHTSCKYLERLSSKCSYSGGSICNENPFITPSTNALGFFAIRQTKDQSVAVIVVHETLFYPSKFNKLHTF